MNAIRLLLVACMMFAGACFAQGAATVVFATGEARIEASDGSPRAAQRGAAVQSGETLDTRDGRIQLRFADGAGMSLQPSTRLRIDDYRFSGGAEQAGEDDRSFLRLLKGGFRTLTGLIGKHKREQYRVDSVVATIGIRGTDYSALLEDDSLLVHTYAGLVEVCSSVSCLQVGAGESVRVPGPGRAPERQAGAGRPPAVSGGEMPVAPQLPAPRPLDLPEAPHPGATVAPSGGQPTSPGAYPGGAPSSNYPGTIR